MAPVAWRKALGLLTVGGAALLVGFVVYELEVGALAASVELVRVRSVHGKPTGASKFSLASLRPVVQNSILHDTADWTSAAP